MYGSAVETADAHPEADTDAIASAFCPGGTASPFLFSSSRWSYCSLVNIHERAVPPIQNAGATVLATALAASPIFDPVAGPEVTAVSGTGVLGADVVGAGVGGAATTVGAWAGALVLPPALPHFFHRLATLFLAFCITVVP